MALIGWDEITKSDDWASSTPAERTKIYQYYLGKLGKEEAWQGLEGTDKVKVTGKMQELAGFNRPVPVTPSWKDALKEPFKALASAFDSDPEKTKKRREELTRAMYQEVNMDPMDMLNYDTIDHPKDAAPGQYGASGGWDPVIKQAPQGKLDRFFSKGVSNYEVQEARIEQEAKKLNLNVAEYKDLRNPQGSRMRKANDFVDRQIRNFGSGALGTVAGLTSTADWILDTDLTGELAAATKVKVAEITPDDQNFFDQFISGVGSMTTFFIPGIGVAKGAQVLKALPTLARWTGAATMTGIEAFVEAGSVYDRVLEKTRGDQVAASTAAQQAFGANVLVLMVTNKLGLWGEQGRAARKAIMSAVMEGSQEGLQEIISSLTAGDPLKADEILRSAAIGSMIGGGASALMSKTGKGEPGHTESEFNFIEPAEGMIEADVWAGLPKGKKYTVAEPDNKKILVDHYSMVDNLETLKPEKAGTGQAGREKERKQVKKTFFYGKGNQPEQIFDRNKKYRSVLDADKIYDVAKDPKGIWADIQDPYAREKALVAAGYDGFVVNRNSRQIYGVFKNTPTVRLERYQVGIAPRAGSKKASVEKELKQLLAHDLTDVTRYGQNSKGVYRGKGEDSPTLHIETGDIEHVKKALTQFGKNHEQESIIVSREVDLPYSNPSQTLKESHGIKPEQGFSLEIDYSDTNANVTDDIDIALASNGVDGYHNDVDEKKVITHHIPEFTDMNPDQWSEAMVDVSDQLSKSFPEMHYQIRWFDHTVIHPAEASVLAESEQIEKEIFPDNPVEILGRVGGVQIRSIRNIRGKDNKARNASEVASLLAPSRKYANEHVWLVATDQDGNILEVNNVSVGLANKAPFSPALMAGRALNIPGTKKIYTVHQHPSGQADMSMADREAHISTIKQLEGQGIEVEDIVLGRESFIANGNDNEMGFPTAYTPIIRKTEIPVSQRFIKTISSKDIVKGPHDAARVLSDLGVNHGVLFMSSNGTPQGFAPFPGLNEKGRPQIGEIQKIMLRAAEQLNTDNCVIVVPSATDPHASLARGLNMLLNKEFNIRDTLVKTPDGKFKHLSNEMMGLEKTIYRIEDHHMMPWTTKGEWGNSFIKGKNGDIYEGPKLSPHSNIRNTFGLTPENIEDSGFVTKDGRYLGRRFPEREERTKGIREDLRDYEADNTQATYAIGARVAGPSDNILVRQTEETSNKDRILLAQVSNKLTAEKGIAESMFDKLYSQREGYNRPDDFWEIPQWAGEAAYAMPKSDFYTIRNADKAAEFLNDSGYKAVMFSAMDANKNVIKEIAKKYSGKVIVGGYVDPSFFKGIDNIEFHDSIQSATKSLGIPYKKGVDYRHFKGTKTVPRLCLSEGCLHKCAFCVVPKGVKATPVDQINAQVENMSDLDFELVYLDDKTFGQAKNYQVLAQIYKRLKKSNPNFNGFVIQTTAPAFSKMPQSFLDKSGIKYVELGMESFNDEILRNVNKPHTTAMLQKAADKIRANNMQFIPNVLVGLAGKKGGKVWSETAETYQNTLDFLEANQDIISHVNVYNLVPYVGTEIGDQLEADLDVDLDENIVERSYLKNPELHNKFYRDVLGFASRMLDKGPKAVQRQQVEEVIQGYKQLPAADQKELDAVRAAIADGSLEVGSMEYFQYLDKYGSMIKGTSIRHTERFPVGAGTVVYGPRKDTDREVEGKILDEYDRVVTNTALLPAERANRLKEMVRLINENKEAMDWYTDWYNYMHQFQAQGMSEDMIQKHLQIIAVLSAGQSISANTSQYKNAINKLEACESLEGVGTPNSRDKVQAIWDGTLSAVNMDIPQTRAAFGNKVGSFIRASLDHPSDSVTVDRWIGRLFGYDFGWNKSFENETTFRVDRPVQREIDTDVFEAAKMAGVTGTQAQAALWAAANPDPKNYIDTMEGDPVEYMPKGMLTIRKMQRSNLGPFTERGEPGNIFIKTKDGYFEGNNSQHHTDLMRQFDIDMMNVLDSGYIRDDGTWYHRVAQKADGTPRTDPEAIKFSIDTYQRVWKQEQQMLRRGVEDPSSDWIAADPAVQERIESAAKASRPISLFGRIVDGFRTLGHKAARTYEHLPKTKEFAQLQFDLLKLSKQKQYVSGQATESIRDMIKGLSRKETNIFERQVMFDDLMETSKEGKSLPFGLTPETLAIEMEHLNTQMTKKVQAAILKRNQIWARIRDDYIRAMDDIGMDVRERVSRAHYFRHQVVDYIETKGLYGTGKRLSTPASRGFLKQRVGSAKDINPNFIGPEAEVMSQMLYDIQIGKVLKTVDKHYNKIDEFRARAKAMDDPDLTWQDLLPGTGYEVWQPLPGHTFYMANAIPGELSQALTEGALEEQIDPALIRQVLAMGGKRRQFVIKSEVAETLNNIQLPESVNIFARGHRKLLRSWKIWQLISPRRYAKYNIRNLTGDADGVFAGNPQAFGRVPEAIRDIVDGIVLNRKKSQNLADWMERGGIASTLQAQEIDDLHALKAATHITGTGLNPWKIYWKAARLSTDAREAVLRYANYLSYKNQMDKHGGIPSNFGASIREEILGLEDIKDRAFWLSNDLLGAYDRVGLMGQSLRAHLFPFWSWKEANARRYYRLFMNAAQDKNLSRTVGRKFLGTVATTPFRAYRIGKFMIKATALWGLLQVWNNLKFPDEEEKLPSHIRTRPHIILGVDEETGETNYFSRLGALPDLLEWFGLDNSIEYVNQWTQGKKSLKEIAVDMAKQPVNIVVQGGEPVMKIAGEVITRRSLFPDVFRPGTVRDRMYHLVRGFGLENEYKLVSKMPSRPWKESLKGVYMYSSDPLQAGYHEWQRVKSDFKKSINKGGEGFWITPKGNALYFARLALRYRDKDAATYYMSEYLKMGGTVSGIVRSIENLNPLAGLSKIEQIALLKRATPEDKKNLVLALKYYLELASGSIE